MAGRYWVLEGSGVFDGVSVVDDRWFGDESNC